MSRQTVLYVAITATAATVAFFIGGAIGQNDDTSAGGCKAALQRTYDAIEAESKAGGEPGPQPTPPQCIGVNDATMKRYGAELFSKEFGESLKDSWSSPPPTP